MTIYELREELINSLNAMKVNALSEEFLIVFEIVNKLVIQAGMTKIEITAKDGHILFI